MLGRFEPGKSFRTSGPGLLMMRFVLFNRQNDLLMLERINELDGKLRSMEKEAHQRQESNTQLQLGSSDFTVNSPGDRPQKSRSENSLPLSRMEVASEVQTPMTPRETSLLSQLDKVMISDFFHLFGNGTIPVPIQLGKKVLVFPLNWESIPPLM